MSVQAKKAFQYRPDHLIQDFREHIRAFGEPHTWRYHTHEPPAPEGAEVLLANFVIPREFVRSKGLAPCPICSPKSPQYAKGHLIWSAVGGTLHAVGHCCGHKHFEDGSFGRGIAAAIELEQRRADETFLMDNWEYPRELLALSRDLTPWARSYDQVVKNLKGGLSPMVCKAIYRAAADGAFLSVEDQVQGLGRKMVSIKTPFGSRPVQGGLVLRGGKRAVSCEGRIKAASLIFEQLDWVSYEDAFWWASSQPSADLKLLARHIKEAVAVFHDAHADFLALQAFLSEENLELVSAWSAVAHAGNPLRLHPHAREDLAIWRGAVRVRRILIPRNIWGPPFALPSLAPCAG
ncbi:hypothetical protein NKI89_03215 [Mesorhizobium sp. M0309]|uniref:hypothetical protein n=1 Tax=Mesorhizobium sp. M0309 TaxID=2956933 RepID=UPI00333A4167